MVCFSSARRSFALMAAVSIGGEAMRVGVNSLVGQRTNMTSSQKVPPMLHSAGGVPATTQHLETVYTQQTVGQVVGTALVAQTHTSIGCVLSHKIMGHSCHVDSILATTSADTSADPAPTSDTTDAGSSTTGSEKLVGGLSFAWYLFPALLMVTPWAAMAHHVLKVQTAATDEGETHYAAEIWRALGLAVPNMVLMVLLWLTQLISMFVLRIRGVPDEITALGFVNMLQSCTYLSFGRGICNVLDATVSHAYGAGDHVLTFTYLQRCRVILTAQLVWVLPVLVFTEKIVLGFGQDSPNVAQLAGSCSLWSVGAPFFTFHTCAVVWFIRNRGQIMPSVVFFLTGNLAHLGACLLFAIHWGMGINGIGLACSVSSFVEFLMSAVYLGFLSPEKIYGLRKCLWIEAPAFTDLIPLVKLAFPCIISASAEFWFWEFATPIISVFGQWELRAHVQMSNLMTIVTRPNKGLTSIGSTLVGQALGQQKPCKARFMLILVVVSAQLFWGVIACFLLAFRKQVIYAYAEDPLVEAHMEVLMTIFIISGFLNISQGVIIGSLRGLGMPQFGACVHFVAYFCFMLPFGWFLAHNGMEMYGVYMAFTIGLAMTFCVLFGTALSMDYPAKSAAAAKKLADAKARILAMTKSCPDMKS